MSAKGIHLALYDTEVFARAIIAKVQKGRCPDPGDGRSSSELTGIASRSPP
ncbi:hypothetical protein [Streptomyces noursei]|uniref:hypothetical protein n=1 Tax=Streptomyces noursei TaxID=1971 RepID=UPI0038163E41